MPLTQEQFQKARQAGFSTEQIIGFEKRRQGEQPQISQQQIQQPQTKPSYYEAAVKPFISEVVSPMAHFGSALAADIPEVIINKYFPQLKPPEQQTILGKVARGVGEIAGFGMGLPTKAGLKATQLATKIPGLVSKRIIPSMVKGAIGGAVGMGTITPKEGLLALKQRLQQAKTGAVVGGIVGAIAPTVIKFKKWLNPKNQLQLADEARNSLIGAKHSLVERYGETYNRVIKQGQGRISLQEPLINLIDESDDIVNTIKGNQEVSEAIAKGEPSAKRLLNVVNEFVSSDKKIPVDLSIQEADGIYKYIRNLPSIRSKLARAYKIGFEQIDFTNADRVLLNFANDIKSQVLNLAPEMNLVNREYANFMTSYKQIRPYLKWNNAITNMKKLHQLDPAVQDLFVRTLPKETTNKILQFNKVNRNAELLKWLGIRGLETGIIGGGIYGGSRLLRR